MKSDVRAAELKLWLKSVECQKILILCATRVGEQEEDTVS